MDDILTLIDKHSRYFTDWKRFICSLLDTGGWTYGAFAKRCGMSRNTVVAWCEKGQVPRSREQFIRIGFAAKMNPDEMNAFLQRYGKYPRLNVKNIDDAVTVFALQNALNYPQSLELKRRFSSLLKDVLSRRRIGRHSDLPYFATDQLTSELLSVSTLVQFEDFVERNREAFANSYVKLIDFIDAYIAMNTMSENGERGTVNSFLSGLIENPAVVTEFNTAISKLRCYGEIPSRNKLIALGIHLRMTADDINTLLEFAGMEKLCAKDKLESLIIFAAENAALQNPGIGFSNAILLRQFTKNAAIREKCDRLLRQYNMEQYLCDDSADIYEYITESLVTLDDDSAEEILHLLGKQ